MNLDGPIRTLACFFLLVVATNFNHTDAIRVSDKIYSVLQSNHYCGRRFNATHQMGCSSNLGGNTGIIWMVRDDTDLEHILKEGLTPPYIAVLKRKFYSRENLLKFKERPDRVAGVVFIEKGQSDDESLRIPFSPEDRCPLRHSGLYSNDSDYANCKENTWLPESPVSGLLYEDIPYPIFLINKKESIDEIEKCFNENNVSKDPKARQASYPLCGIQLDSFMLAVENSEYCLNTRSMVDELLQVTNRRCDAISNQNIFAYYKPVFQQVVVQSGSVVREPTVLPPQSIIMLAAKLSSVSMFTDQSPGADSTITSIVTMLAVAEALGRIRSSSGSIAKSNKNIAFALLDSEPFDYTGSNRMAKDMNNNTYPMGEFTIANTTDVLNNINLASIEYFMNLDQLALYPKTRSIYLHLDPENTDSSKSRNLQKILNDVSSSEKLDFKSSQPKKLPLPPTPVQEFIRQSLLKGDGSDSPSKDSRLFGFVLSNYDKSFNNLFYHSIYDNLDNVNQVPQELADHLTRVASFVAKSLFRLAFGSEGIDQVTVQPDIVKDLLSCYMTSANCALFTKACYAGQQLSNGPIQTYKDPAIRSGDLNGAITANMLAYFLGDRRTDLNLTQCMSEEKKSYVYNYKYVNGKDTPVSDDSSGLCIQSQVFQTSASSYAYEIDQDSLEITVNDTYPAWTISLNGIRNPVRLYLVPSPVFQWCIFLFGICVTVTSFAIVLKVREHIAQAEEMSHSHSATPT